MAYLPNLVTVLRMLLVIPALVCLWKEAWLWALLLIGLAGLSDAVDGALARRFNWTTAFGAVLDPIADKLVLGVAFIVLAIQDHFPLWLVAVIVGRDLVILAGVIGAQVWFKSVEINTLGMSKVSTAAQVAAVMLLLASLGEVPGLEETGPTILDPWGYLVVAALAVVSGTIYMVKGMLYARGQLNERASVSSR